MLFQKDIEPTYSVCLFLRIIRQTLEKGRDIALKAGINFVYIGNVPAHLAENTFCHECKRMIIERKGFIILKNDLADGKCKYCGEKNPGVWK
jgi:pyruvate formate lyase activating enzyme